MRYSLERFTKLLLAMIFTSFLFEVFSSLFVSLLYHRGFILSSVFFNFFYNPQIDIFVIVSHCGVDIISLDSGSHSAMLMLDDESKHFVFSFVFSLSLCLYYSTK